MAKIYKRVVREIEEDILIRIVCDRCNRCIKTEPDGHTVQINQDYFALDTSWGYFSNHKDTQRHRAIICEPCYDIIFKDVKIEITHYL